MENTSALPRKKKRIEKSARARSIDRQPSRDCYIPPRASVIPADGMYNARGLREQERERHREIEGDESADDEALSRSHAHAHARLICRRTNTDGAYA